MYIVRKTSTNSVEVFINTIIVTERIFNEKVSYQNQLSLTLVNI